jgi:hypothetical protein
LYWCIKGVFISLEWNASCGTLLNNSRGFNARQVFLGSDNYLSLLDNN